MNMSMYTDSCFCICYCLFVCLVWDWYPPKTDPQSLGVPFCEKLRKIKSRGSRPRQRHISKIWANLSGNIPPRRGHVDHVVFVWGEGPGTWLGETCLSSSIYQVSVSCELGTRWAPSVKETEGLLGPSVLGSRVPNF